ncbi:MAG: hypothetical protein FWC48_01540 [Actinomycetia bacterium]|nr:hypothetical protein [Actinomycetes bacterium]
MKRLLALTLAIALTLALAGCGAKKSTLIDEALKKAENASKDSSKSSSVTGSLFAAQDEIKAKMTNYDFTMKMSSGDGEANSSRELYIKDKVLITQMDGSDNVTYVDFAANKTYTLNTADKTGQDQGSASSSNTGMLFSILMNFGLTQSMLLKDNDLIKPKKLGSETIAGQKCTGYSYSFGGASIKFWIDDEYGLALKTEGGTSSWEVTEFKVGGADPASWINLSDFKIESL